MGVSALGAVAASADVDTTSATTVSANAADRATPDDTIAAADVEVQADDGPSVTSDLSVAAAPFTGGTQVTVTGEELDQVAAVTVGGAPATIVAADAGQVTFAVPAVSDTRAGHLGRGAVRGCRGPARRRRDADRRGRRRHLRGAAARGRAHGCARARGADGAAHARAHLHERPRRSTRSSATCSPTGAVTTPRSTPSSTVTTARTSRASRSSHAAGPWTAAGTSTGDRRDVAELGELDGAARLPAHPHRPRHRTSTTRSARS